MSLLNRIAINKNKVQDKRFAVPPGDDRLAVLAVELGLAGGEVLQEHFGFTVEQTAKWLDLMLDKAKVNRVNSLARLAVEQIDDKARER